MIIKNVTKKLSITTKGLDELPRIGNVPSELFRLLSREGLTLTAWKFLTTFLLNIKKMQIHKDEQLLLKFEEDWYDVDKEYVLQVDCNFSNFLPKGYKNYEELKNALIFLSNIKHTFEDDKMLIKAEMISNLKFIKNKGFTFIMNAYWLQKFIDISKFINYNIETIYNISSVKSLVFYMYIKSFPFIKLNRIQELGFKQTNSSHRGGKIAMSTIRELLNIPDDLMLSRVKANHIDPIRNMLDKKAEESFNYKIINDCFYFISYKPSYDGIEDEKEEINKYIRFIDNRAKKYLLSPIETYFLANKVITYSLSFLNETTARKKELKGIKGKEWLDAFNLLIDNSIKQKTVPMGFFSNKLTTDHKIKITKKYNLIKV